LTRNILQCTINCTRDIFVDTFEDSGVVAISNVNQLPCSLGEFKQAVMKEYNHVNQLIFKNGVIEQKVTAIENKIIIMAKIKRTPALKIIEDSSSELIKAIDRLLFDQYKTLLKEQMEERFQFKICYILQDYSPNHEVSGTVIILEQQINDYLAGEVDTSTDESRKIVRI
jgi:hypothetical protein